VGGRVGCISGRRRRGRKLAHDPAVELALCQREPKRPLDTLTLGEDLRRSERVERGGVTVELHRLQGARVVFGDVCPVAGPVRLRVELPPTPSRFTASINVWVDAIGAPFPGTCGVEAPRAFRCRSSPTGS